MTREDTERRIARYEAHAARVRELTAARQAVIDAARVYFSGGSPLAKHIQFTQLREAVRALEKLEAEE